MYKSLIDTYPLISDQIEYDELAVLLDSLEKCIDHSIDGDVVEFGCYTGTTSLFIQRLLLRKNSTKKFYVYDSFDGLPEKSQHDLSPLGMDFKRGELRATKNEFIHNFRKASLPLPIITKGWFHLIEESSLPEKISFAFLDGDYYKSLRSSLSLIEKKMTPGSVIVIDDYDNERLPGAKKAADEWTKGRKLIIRPQSSLGIIHIPQ